MNKLSTIRRSLAACIAISAGAFLLATAASAQDQRSSRRPISLYVGFAPGSAPDTFARGVAQGLQELGISAVVVSKLGAGGGLAASEAARAAADGSVLMLASDTPMVVLPHLQKMSYDSLADFRPVAMVGTTPMMLVASPASHIKTFNDFITAAKARPGAIDYGSWGIGSGHHVLMERLQQAAGIKVNHIPYGTSSPVPDLVAGRFPVMWASVSSVLPLIASGRLVPLVTGTESRLSALPDVPTMAEVGFPKFEAGIWNGVFAPAKTPPAVIQELEQNLRKVALSSTFRAFVAAQSLEVKFMNAADYRGKVIEDFSRNRHIFPTPPATKN